MSSAYRSPLPLEDNSFTISKNIKDGSSFIHLHNYTGTLNVSSTGIITVSSASSTVSPASVVTTKKSPLGAPPPGASPFTVAPPQPQHHTSTTTVGEATCEFEDIAGAGGEAAAAAAHTAVDAADLITADWGAAEEAPAARPVAKRARNSASSSSAVAAAVESGGGGGGGGGGGSVISRQQRGSGGDTLLSTTTTNFSHLILPAGASLEDEGSATLLGSSWVSIDPLCCGVGPSPRWGAASASVDDERIVFYGGEDEHGVVRGDTWSLNISSSFGDAWACRVDDTDAISALSAAAAAAATAAGTGAAIASAMTTNNNSNGASPRMWHSLVAVPERNFLVAIGKVEGGAPSSELEIDVFDTSIDLW